MLSINPTYNTQYTSPINQNRQIRTIKPQNDTVQFKGRVGHEVIKNGKKNLTLIQETAFFREPDTLNWAIKYIQNKFAKNTKIRIIVGACSSGEEALSFKMLMKDRKTEILGFDAGENAIKKANKHIYQISRPKDKKNAEFAKEIGLSAYKDGYLSFSSRPLTGMHKKHQELFNKFFEEIETPEHKTSLITKFRNYLLEKMGRTPDIEVKSRTYKLKNPETLNCNFMVGNIEQMDKFTPKGKAHILSFRNAFYHIMNEDLEQFERTPLPDKELKPILDNIGKQANRVLEKDGLFILGEHEDKQGSNMKLLSEVLKNSGFTEAVENRNNYCNIWKKVKDL